MMDNSLNFYERRENKEIRTNDEGYLVNRRYRKSNKPTTRSPGPEAI